MGELLPQRPAQFWGQNADSEPAGRFRNALFGGGPSAHDCRAALVSQSSRGQEVACSWSGRGMQRARSRFDAQYVERTRGRHESTQTGERARESHEEVRCDRRDRVGRAAGWICCRRSTLRFATRQKSALCAGLSNVFQMEEDTDRNRDSVDGGIQLLEASNTDVARAAGKIDSYAASFSGTDGTYLHIPRGGSLINSSTVAMWMYPTSSAGEQIILSADEATKHGPYLSLVPSGGNVKVKGVAFYGDGRGDVSVTSTPTMTINAWHLVVWGYDQAEASDFLTTSQTGRVMYVQVDNGARDKVGLAYFPIVGPFIDLVLGQRKGSGVSYTLPYSGRVDQLTFAGRTWDSVDATEFYNVGSGKAYPFVPSSYDSLNAGLVAYWKFDEAVSSGTRYDSVNQNNATDISSNQGYTTGKIGNAADSTVVNSHSEGDYQLHHRVQRRLHRWRLDLHPRRSVAAEHRREVHSVWRLLRMGNLDSGRQRRDVQRWQLHHPQQRGDFGEHVVLHRCRLHGLHEGVQDSPQQRDGVQQHWHHTSLGQLR